MLYASSRLYINFFQPSFKLKAKTRDGAHVSKTYHAPATPCDRLLASPDITESVKTKLRKQFVDLDPVRLLRDIRSAQEVLSAMASHGPRSSLTKAPEVPEVSTYLQSLATAWKAGKVRATHRRQAAQAR